MIILRSLCIFLSFYVVFDVQAQSILYEYDEAGNRTSRTYYQVQMPQERSAKITPDTVVVKTQSSALSVKVYPNPTKGDLILSIDGLEQSKTVTLRLFDPNGTQILQKNVSAGTNSINMSKMKTGLYLLQVINAKERLNFKIIKE